MRTLAGRLILGGLLGGLIVGVAGRVWERARFGSTDDEALSRVEAEFRRQFDSSAGALSAMADRVASARVAIRLAQRDPTTVTRLFDVVSDALPADQAGRTGLTIYDTVGRPLAWGGRVSDVGKDRISGPSALRDSLLAIGIRICGHRSCHKGIGEKVRPKVVARGTRRGSSQIGKIPGDLKAVRLA